MANDRPEQQRRKARSGGAHAKGLAKATRAPIFVERTHRVLSREAEEILFEHAEVLDWSAEGLARLRLLTDLSPQWRHGAELQGQFCLQDGHLLSLVCV